MTDAIDRLAAALADRYRIERELGQGGMATVYLAEDLKHKRKVALKVLRPELAAMLGAERFVQEITTTAALQHPHILPLFDSGTADGFLYYVMPFIDGETLRSRLDRETQLGVDDAVRIASDVASALDYAHRHGVIHRDIKPENILLHDGRPMVADFGIALAVSAAAGGRMTETGLSLGTPHYMSPEQATAEKDLTSRSDIYSLGSVLFEMLTGNPPHVGASAQQIIMKIVTDEARPVTELRKSVPPNVAAAVSKSLEKLPADRFSSAAEFGAALSDTGYRIPGHQGTESRARLTALPPYRLTALLLILLVAAAWGWLRPRRAAESGRPWRVRIVLPDSAPVGEALSLSRDGSVLVWDGGGHVWMRRADATEPVPIAGADGGQYPALSPDGRRVLFARGGALFIVTLGGGTPEVVVPTTPIGTTSDWLDDDHIVQAGLTGLVRVAIAGGAGRPLTNTDSAAGEVLHVELSGLPDGRGVVFTIARRNFDSSLIAVVGPEGGAVTRLFPGIRAVFAAPNHLIVTRKDGSIVAVPFDLKRLRVTGNPVPIVSGLGTGGFSVVGRVAASATGRLIYVAAGWGQTQDPADLVWVSPGGVVSPLDTSWVGAFQSVALSPDGRRAVVGMASDQTEDLLVRDLASRSLARVTIPGTLLRDPSFSPDGRSLYFAGLGGNHGLHRVDAGAAGPPERVVTTEFTGIGQPVLAGDGVHLYYLKAVGTTLAVFRHTLAGRTADSAITPTGIRTLSPQVSPDGRWLAFLAVAQGLAEVHVRSTDLAHSEDWRVAGAANPNSSLRWSRDGKQLFFVASNTMMSAPVTTTASFAAGTPRPLFSTTGLRVLFDVGPDGRFLMIRWRPQLRPRTELEMLERWTDLLPR